MQRTGSDARRIELLQDGKHLLQFFGCGVYAVIDGQFVSERVQFLPQETVIVERANEILDDVTLFSGQFVLCQLFIELIVERSGVAVDNLLVLLSRLLSLIVDGIGHLVVASDVLQGRVEGILAFLAFGHGLIVVAAFAAVGAVCGISQFSIAVVGGRRLQCRIVVELCKDALLELGERHFEQAHL